MKNHTTEPSASYRRGVGLVLICGEKGLVGSGKRAMGPGEALRVDGWQWPQGGIEPGESPEDTLYREMEEEIGTRDFTLLRRTGWIAYDFPREVQPKIYDGRYLGQAHLWFAASLNKGAHIHIQTACPEFSEWSWMPIQPFLDQVVSFKKQAYQEVYAAFQDLIG